MPLPFADSDAARLPLVLVAAAAGSAMSSVAGGGTLATFPALAVYGGYFGAGIGILMPAALGFTGFTHIHRMNGLENWCALCINVVAAITFAVSDLVDWPVAIAMAGGALIGGYGGSRLALRIAPNGSGRRSSSSGSRVASGCSSGRPRRDCAPSGILPILTVGDRIRGRGTRWCISIRIAGPL